MINFKTISIFALAVIGLQSCKTASSNTLWVSGVKTDCETAAGMTKCLNVQRGEELDAQPWQTLTSNIDGFQFEEGFAKKITIKSEKMDAKDVPADALSMKYTQVKELRKIADDKTALSGSWVLANLDGKPLNRMIVLPTLNIDLAKMQVSGNGGCNTYSGGFKSLNSKEMRLGDMLNTMMACNNENIEAQYLKKLSTADYYTVRVDILTIYNKFGDNILSFYKKK